MATEPIVHEARGEESEPLAAIGRALKGEFDQLRKDRRSIEDEWMKDAAQYMGQYDESVKIAKGESRIFIPRTRTKVRTLDARIGEIVLPINKKLWEIEPSPEPTLPDERREWLIRMLQESAMQRGLDPASVSEDHIKELEIEIAKSAAKAMSLKVADVLAESRFHEEARKVYQSGHRYGLGILKGPMLETRESKYWTPSADGQRFEVSTKKKDAPYLYQVKVWDFYADFTAPCLAESEFFYETHSYTKKEMYGLAKREDFRGPIIKGYVKEHPQGDKEWATFQTDLFSISRIDPSNEHHEPHKRYYVAERWGCWDVEDLREMGVELPDEFQGGLVEACVWFMVATGEVIKARLNPYDKYTRPYHFYIPYPEETHPLGASIPFDMRNTQQLYNAITRMAVNHGAFTSKPQFEVAYSRLYRPDLFGNLGPGKVHFVNDFIQTNTPAIRPIEVNNQLPVYLQFLANAKIMDDESVALPSFQHGEKSGGAGRTFQGLNLLMGAANLMLKEPLSAWDEMFEGLLRGIVDWFMQFDPDPNIKGDFAVQVRGTYSVIARELKAEKLIAYKDSTSNQFDAPFVNRRELLLELNEALEIDPRIIKSEAQISEELMAQQQAQMGANAQPGTGPNPSGGIAGDGGVSPPGTESPASASVPSDASAEGGG